MLKKLSDECLSYVLHIKARHEFRWRSEVAWRDALISPRFLHLYSNYSYSLLVLQSLGAGSRMSLQYGKNLHLEVCFFGLDEDGGPEHYKPFISILALFKAIRGNKKSKESALNVRLPEEMPMTLVEEVKVGPLEPSPPVCAAVWHIAIAENPIYNPEYLRGSPRDLYPIAMNQDDPRVFEEVFVKVTNPVEYCPFVFNIKTKHLNNILVESTWSYENLPMMPFLEILTCQIWPIGIFDKSSGYSYYKEISKRLANLAPNLKQVNLVYNAQIATELNGQMELGVKTALSAFNQAIEGLQCHLEKVQIHFIQITVVFLENRPFLDMMERIKMPPNPGYLTIRSFLKDFVLKNCNKNTQSVDTANVDVVTRVRPYEGPDFLEKTARIGDDLHFKYKIESS
ncbi:unnamed protein product [Bursaphelenchus xylophilus]|uniref:(pine wood nematode) hypothetical protein n=1 Tax=Bursaphelenchus xylophilus TaxID=6326 RepID=A0A7I8WLA1_BURXY|nr:unnamed protein product [Bursaphelenchus xylophilus]CAG9105939.1 unnamed protein product [Bursaphelenchus xylophilus]